MSPQKVAAPGLTTTTPVCMCVFGYARMHARTRVCACVCVCMYACMHACACACTYTKRAHIGIQTRLRGRKHTANRSPLRRHLHLLVAISLALHCLPPPTTKCPQAAHTPLAQRPVFHHTPDFNGARIGIREFDCLTQATARVDTVRLRLSHWLRVFCKCLCVKMRPSVCVCVCVCVCA